MTPYVFSRCHFSYPHRVIYMIVFLSCAEILAPSYHLHYFARCFKGRWEKSESEICPISSRVLLLRPQQISLRRVSPIGINQANETANRNSCNVNYHHSLNDKSPKIHLPYTAKRKRRRKVFRCILRLPNFAFMLIITTL